VFAFVYRKLTEKKDTLRISFLNTDSDMENSETSGWLDFAMASKYISEEEYKILSNRNEETGQLLNHMIDNLERY
jgi:four helix bundle protein